MKYSGISETVPLNIPAKTAADCGSLQNDQGKTVHKMWQFFTPTRIHLLDLHFLSITKGECTSEFTEAPVRTKFRSNFGIFKLV